MAQHKYLKIPKLTNVPNIEGNIVFETYLPTETSHKKNMLIQLGLYDRFPSITDTLLKMTKNADELVVLGDYLNWTDLLWDVATLMQWTELSCCWICCNIATVQCLIIMKIIELNSSLVGVVDFRSYRSLFLTLFASSQTSYTVLPSLAPLYGYPYRNWKDTGPKGGKPAVTLTLEDLVMGPQLSYHLTTDRKSSEAIEKLHSVILSVPMLAVDVHQEIIEVQQLVHICKEHILTCDKDPVDEHQLHYDKHNPFILCGQTFHPIYHGKPEEKCPLCGASYMPQFKGTVCTICSLEVDKCPVYLSRNCRHIKMVGQ